MKYVRRDGLLLYKHPNGDVNLIPYGQNVADHQTGVSLNEPGVLMWELLKAPQDLDSLTAALAAEYEAEADEISELRRDVQEFLDMLNCHGLVCSAEQTMRPESPLRCSLAIGGLRIALHGPDGVCPPEFRAFVAEDADTPGDMTVDVVCHPCFDLHGGEILMRNESLTVFFDRQVYTLLFPEFKQLTEAIVSRDARCVRLHLMSVPDDEGRTEILHALRHIYLLRARLNGLFAIHSVSLLYRGRVWLFSGHSGMGKSTHTRMWNEMLGTPIINGDLNLLSIDDQHGPIVHGIPWCGTSGISTTGSWPLGGIVLLGRAPFDHTEPLSPSQRHLQATQRMISPVWTEEMLRGNLAFMLRVTDSVPVYKLLCTKQHSAVETIKREIDAYCDLKGFDQ